MHRNGNRTVANRFAVVTVARGITGPADPANLVEDD